MIMNKYNIMAFAIILSAIITGWIIIWEKDNIQREMLQKTVIENELT